MRVLSLFSGIGLHDLGLERAGFQIVAQVERDPWCVEVLKQHWPEVPKFDDVRTVSADALRLAGVGRVDLITGGFPCQPHSVAGKRKGVDDERHLWPEYARIIREVRPAWVLAENVPGLRTTAADLVLGDLEAEGYSCWPLVVGACDVGAPHRRKRVWIVAHARRDTVWHEQQRLSSRRETGVRDEGTAELGGCCAPLANRDSAGLHRLGCSSLLDGERAARGHDADGRGERAVGDACGEGLASGRRCSCGSGEALSMPAGARCDVPDAEGERRPEQGDGRDAGSRTGRDGPRWPSRQGEPQYAWEAPRLTQPGLGGATDGRARRLDSFARRNRLKALGNGNPPQVVEAIGRAILTVTNQPEAA